jgi:hypothetical protein
MRLGGAARLICSSVRCHVQPTGPKVPEGGAEVGSLSHSAARCDP